MAQVHDAVPPQMTATIVEAADPEQMTFFGSRTGGEAEAGSDVGLVVFEAEPFGPGPRR